MFLRSKIFSFNCFNYILSIQIQEFLKIKILLFSLSHAFLSLKEYSNFYHAFHFSNARKDFILYHLSQTQTESHYLTAEIYSYINLYILIQCFKNWSYFFPILAFFLERKNSCRYYYNNFGLRFLIYMQHYRSTICKQLRTMYVYLVGNRFSITVKSLQARGSFYNVCIRAYKNTMYLSVLRFRT